MLRGVRRDPADLTAGIDGVTFHFSAFVLGEGVLAGETWSPEEGTQSARLVRVGTTLREFVEAPASARPVVLERLRNDAQALANGGG
jgi:hypothetical protein